MFAVATTPPPAARASFAARPAGCRNCGHVPAGRPRGLCCSCHRDPAIRAAFPSTSKYARRGTALGNRRPTVTPAPTPALPGSDEKLLALIARAEAGLSLWHPLDGLLPS